MDSNRITKTPALNPRPAPERERKGEGSMAECGYERLDGGKREKRGPFSASTDREGLSEPVYPRTRVYDDY